MLISHRKRFIYTKTVKTAGTSVESYFEPYCMPEGEWGFSHARNEYVSEAGIIGVRTGDPLHVQGALWWNHMPARTIRALIGEKVWNDYFKFCVVRNPYDAVVSAYRFFWASKQPAREEGYFSRLAGRFAKPDPTARIRDDFEKWLESVPLPIDQNKYLIDGRPCMDYVIRYEALAEGIRHVCNELSIEYRADALPHLKKSEKSKLSLKAYFSPMSLARVEQAYRYELDAFGYTRPWESQNETGAAA